MYITSQILYFMPMIAMIALALRTWKQDKEKVTVARLLVVGVIAIIPGVNILGCWAMTKSKVVDKELLNQVVLDFSEK